MRAHYLLNRVAECVVDGVIPGLGFISGNDGADAGDDYLFASFYYSLFYLL